MIELNKLEKKHHFNSKKLSEILPDFYKYTSTFNNPDYKPFLAEMHFNVLINYFEQIIDITVKELKIKEEYEIYSSEKSEIIAKVGFVSSNFEFTIGLFRDFYLIWEIKNPDSIKNMKDEFWTLLFEFSKLGRFQYKEKLVDLPNLKKKHPNLFNKRSNFYKLFINFLETII